MLLYLFCNKSHYENVPFEIPENWCWTTIDDVNLYNSSSIEPNKSPYKDFELYSVPTFESGMPEFVKGSEISSAKKIVAQGDVLLCKINPHLNRAWIVTHYDRNRDCIASSEWIICRNNNIEPRFLAYCFTSPYFMELMLSNVSGVGGSLMRAQPASVGKYIFPLPPIKEQIRIVVELDKWLMMIDELDIEKQDLFLYIKQIKSKILDLAISGKLVPQDPDDEPAIELLKRINPAFKPCDNSHYGNLPQGWVKLRLGDVCSFERGITFPSSAKCTIKQPGMIACIRTANVQDNLELDDLWYVGNEYIKGNTEKLVRKNDIIMSSANSRELVGKVSYVHDLTEQMTFGGFVLNIRANECILPFFLFLMLRTLYLKGYYLTIATQTTNIANLNTKILGDIEVLLPPLTEQERIINSVTNILASIENITAELS